MKLTKASVRRAAEKFKGTLTDTQQWDCQIYEFEVEAPDGYRWVDGPSAMVVRWVSYDNDNQDAFEGAIERISYGIELNNEK